MRYAMMIYADPHYGDSLSEAERDAVHAEFLALAEDPRCVGFARLHPADTATSVRWDGGRTLITDGPFADTKEVLGGFCMIEAADLDEALDLAALVPSLRHGSIVEVRPVVES